MAFVSPLPPLFNAETCPSYLHTLRRKERPPPWPRCQRHHVGPWGTDHDQPGLQRYRGHEHACQRPFNARTGPRLDGRKRARLPWRRAPCLWCRACASRRMARAVGGHSRTSYRWSWWRRHAVLADEMQRPRDGPVAAEALSPTAGHTGPAPQGGKKSLGRRARGRRKKRAPGRGPSAKDRRAIRAGGRRQGGGGRQATSACTVQTVPKAADLARQRGRRRCPDSARSARALPGYLPAEGTHTQKAEARGDGPENRAAGVLALLTPSLRVWRGVSTITLPG